MSSRPVSCQCSAATPAILTLSGRIAAVVGTAHFEAARSRVPTSLSLQRQVIHAIRFMYEMKG